MERETTHTIRGFPKSFKKAIATKTRAAHADVNARCQEHRICCSPQPSSPGEANVATERKNQRAIASKRTSASVHGTESRSSTFLLFHADQLLHLSEPHLPP